VSSHALACAGIIEQGKWVDPELTIETVEKEESRLTLDVNLVGTCMFARIAVVYLKHEKKQGEDKSLTLISSAAGFRESPGLWMYQVRAAPLRHLSGLLPKRFSVIGIPSHFDKCSKHGVMGLMRTLRKMIYQRDGTRINAVCPGITDTK
jgi:NAD(P)-dependent dehydrogenase (short-subunit alcohol dehydrogenase family)